MRLPFPTRVPLKGALLFALALTGAQLVEKTAPLFSLCSFLFIMIAAAAFNLAGGFSSTSGSYVFFYSVLGVILGLSTKAVIGQPADSNLNVPQRDILVYLVSIAAMYAAVFISRKLTPKKGILQDVVADRVMLDSAVGCLITGLSVFILGMVLPRSEGSVLSAISQINRFLPMAIILGTIYQIRKSGGTSSVNAVVLLGIAANFVLGLIVFSKEGIFTGPVCWLIAASSQRYRLSRSHLIGLLAGGALMVLYLVPYSQYGRSFDDPNSSGIKTSIYLLSNLSDVRETYNANSKETQEESQSYFGRNMGLLERLQMIGPDDGLIAVTEEKGQFGLYPIYAAFGNLVPHFIWPDKPLVYFGNVYAHEVGGVIGDEDESTGISFSPSGEGYHLAGWYGVAFLAPVLWIMLFTLFDSLCGSTLEAPWGLLVMVIYSHVAPEGMLDGVIYCLGFVAFGVVVAALAAAYVMPILGGLAKGPGRIESLPPQGHVHGHGRRSNLAAHGAGH